MHRTSLHKDRSLVVIQGATTEAFWPAAEARKAALTNDQHSVTLFVYQAMDDEPCEEIPVDIYTPRGMLTDWAIFLTPPLSVRFPPFSLAEVEDVRQGPRGVTMSHMETYGLPDSDTFRALSVLVNEEYLSASVIYRAVQNALAQHDPLLLASHALVWEFTVPSDYGNAILTYYHLYSAAYEAPSREEFLARRARSDQYWCEYVLPLEAILDASRLIEIPEHLLEEKEREAEREDQELFGAVDFSKPYSARFPDMEEVDPSADEAYRTVASTPGLYDLVCSMVPLAGRYPDLPIDRALEWLNRYRGAFCTPGGKKKRRS